MSETSIPRPSGDRSTASGRQPRSVASTRRRSIGPPASPHNAATGGPTRAPSSSRTLRTQTATVRFPIALKYALITGALLVSFMAYLGHSFYRVSFEEVDRRVNDTGIKLVLSVANLTEPFWTNKNLSDDQLKESQARLTDSLRSFINERGSAGILEVLVFGKDPNNYLAAASGSQRLNLIGGAELANPQAKQASVTIHTGSVTSSTFSGQVRSYEHDILRGGEKIGSVRVFLSAAAIEKNREKMMRTIFTYALLATLSGIVVVIFVGGLLTRPIRRLRKDMEIVSRGDLQHKSTIRSADELEQLASSFNRMTEHLQDAQDREASRKALERELSIATRIQTALLPDRIPRVAGYDLFPYYASAREVGGDYYDFIKLGDGHFGIVVADVSGKGIPGSLVMTMTRSLVRMAARETTEPAEILARVNYSLSRDMTRGMFVTLVYADFDAKNSRIRLARAGHNPAYLFRANAGTVMTIQPPGIALGMDPGPMFRKTLEVQETSLGIGDFLALYTDGVIEAMDENGNEYTAERFGRTLNALSGQEARKIVDGVLQDLQAHVGRAEPSDDITLLVLKRTN